MRNKLISVCLLVLLLAALPLTAMAQQFDGNQKGSISVTLQSPVSDHPMAGAELSVYHVAKVSADPKGNLNYSYTEAFHECGIPLHDPDLAQKLDAYVSANAVSARKIVTDSEGNALCADLPLGLYFVKETVTVEGFAPSKPFLVTLPMKTDSGYEYHVDASPKTEVVRYADITIKKVWNMTSSTGTPASVTVELLKGGEVVETAVLNRQNNWQITYLYMPESDDYSIRETDVPQGFTAAYSQDGYVFTVTNTPTTTPPLAQTGQLIWPIPVFALAGLLFLIAGLLILRKTGKQDA